ncbi:hypothetical protein AnigIFM63604_011257 [Aspergillus niger]|uniref:NAD-dependent epimerase/dehydratase domain-containing protein n=1 Tax=Aspergillus niger TaxID=5061 RepID=A0A9W6EDA7_ASPNG|nr:hypothetical protein AnigIFM63604_011257 [Aspergillus niger]
MDTIYCLPEGSHILVTGGNGFVASNVTQTLLELGFKVRGTVRTPKPWLDEMFKARFGDDSFQSVVVADFDDIHTLAGVMEDVSGVAHVASDVSFEANPERVISWAVRAVQNVLEAASTVPSIQRVVLTSSGVSATTPKFNKGAITIYEQYVVDVVDIARLHAVAILDPKVVSQRLFGYASPLNLTEIITILRRLRPDNDQLPDAPEADWHDQSTILPAKHAERLLQEFCGKEGWTSAEDSIAEGIKGC